MNIKPSCSGRMLTCNKTVQCLDCLCVWYGDNDETFLTDHPTPWEIIEDDEATSRPDYGALANIVAGDLKIDDDHDDPRHECRGISCEICTELREMYEDPVELD
jgi:hypothetical protein